MDTRVSIRNNFVSTMKLIIALAVLVAAAQALPTVQWSKITHRRATRPTLASAVPHPRIIGGTKAKVGEIPFQAGVFLDGSGFCGGSLISETVVLTAGHCAIGTRKYEIYLGSIQVLEPSEEGRVVVTSTDGVLHEDYDDFNINNDIALVRLGSPVTLTDNIKPVLLAPATSGDFLGETATVSGWGLVSDESFDISEDLMYTDVTVQDNSVCEDVYGDVMTDTKVCVDTNNGQNAPCNGDSGGPLVVYNNGVATEIGLVSFGSSAGCEAGYPDVFTRISSYVDWVEANGGPAARR